MSDNSIPGPNPVNDEGGTHNVSDSEHSDSGEDAALDRRFTDANHAYLATRKAEYLAGSRSKRRDVAQDAARHIIQEIEAGGRQLQGTEKTALRKNVRRWFSQRCRATKDKARSQVNWNGRQVFYLENKELVAATQVTMFREAGGVMERNTEEEERNVDFRDIDLDLSDDDDARQAESGPASDPTRKLSLFAFFQKALSKEWGSLTPALQVEYENKARQWKEQGPTVEQRRILAEKEGAAWVRDLATSAQTQMNMRLVSLIGYEDTGGRLCIAMIDRNGAMATGASFKRDCRTEIQESDIMNIWGRWCKQVFSEDQDRSESPGRSRGLALVHFDRNPYGEPILKKPSTYVLAGETAWTKLVRVLRSYLTIFYALAKGTEPKNTSVPWATIAKMPRNFIDPEYLPDNMINLLRDPGAIGVTQVTRLLNHFYSRSSEPIAFEFKCYAADKKGTAKAREPRSLVEDDTPAESGLFEDVVDPCFAPLPPPLSQHISSLSAVSPPPNASALSNRGRPRRMPARRGPSARNIVLSDEEDIDSGQLLLPPSSPMARSTPGLTETRTVSSTRSTESPSIVTPGSLTPTNKPSDGVDKAPNTPPAWESLDPALREQALLMALQLHGGTHPRPFSHGSPPPETPVIPPTPERDSAVNEQFEDELPLFEFAPAAGSARAHQSDLPPKFSKGKSKGKRARKATGPAPESMSNAEITDSRPKKRSELSVLQAEGTQYGAVTPRRVRKVRVRKD